MHHGPFTAMYFSVFPKKCHLLPNRINICYWIPFIALGPICFTAIWDLFLWIVCVLPIFLRIFGLFSPKFWKFFKIRYINLLSVITCQIFSSSFITSGFWITVRMSSTTLKLKQNSPTFLLVVVWFHLADFGIHLIPNFFLLLKIPDLFFRSVIHFKEVLKTFYPAILLVFIRRVIQRIVPTMLLDIEVS